MYEPKVYFPLTYNIGTQKPIFHHVLNFSVFQPFQPILVSQKKKKKKPILVWYLDFGRIIL